jgi:hypothetical protein
VRSPSVRAAPIVDLRAELNRRREGEDAPTSLKRPDDLRIELNHRRAGEDARVSLERARERWLNFEGCNLDQDFVAVAPQTPTGARIQAGVPLAGVGCAALADHLRAATWSSKFWPHLLEKYDGTSNPSEFLQVYVTAITAEGGDTAVMETYFHVALFGPAQDLAHEPHPRIDLLMGRALCVVHSELCQLLSPAQNKRPRPQGGNSGSCPVHPNSRHSASECREIIKLAKRVSERREQTSKDGSPPRRRPGKERVDDGDVAVGERDLGYQSPEQVLKDILTGDSNSGDDNDRRKKLYMMYGESW